MLLAGVFKNLTAQTVRKGLRKVFKICISTKSFLYFIQCMRYRNIDLTGKRHTTENVVQSLTDLLAV